MESYIKILNTLNKSTDDYLFVWEIQNNRVWISGQIDERFGLQNKGVPYCTVEEILEVIYPNDRWMLQEEFRLVQIGKSNTCNVECRWVDLKDNMLWVTCNGNVQLDEEGRPFIMLGRISDTAFRQKVDSLTGKFNKVKMFEDLDEIFATNEPGFLMVLGIDDFKNINIHFGRKYGDKILRQVADVLEEVMGSVLQIYRLDGDLFAIHLYGSNSDAVEIIYDKIREKLPQDCTASAGVVYYSDLPIKDKNLIYQYAESALDKSKRNGKDQVTFFFKEDFQEKLAEIELLEEIKWSIRNDYEGFYLFYQPQVKSEGYHLYGAEALLRYKSPTKGVVFPDKFIPLLEDTGLICPVGLWVLETALSDCKRWREKNPDVHVSVNVSYVQLEEEDIVDDVLDILKASGLPGEALTLEVTESKQLQDFVHYNEVFERWKKTGIEISVDDFGTGYSSLAYLKELRVDEIKIDRCFVSGIQFASYNYHLVSNVLELAKDANIRVCCEGVEKKEEMKVLGELNTYLMQGYLFSKPCPKEEFEKLYINNGEPEYYGRLQLAEFWKTMILGRKSVPAEEQTVAAENMRLTNFCQALLSETVAYAELDVEKGQVLRTGGIWNEDMTLPEKVVSILEEKEWTKEQVAKKITIEHEINGELRQIELMVHMFKEQYSGQRYALLYQVGM